MPATISTCLEKLRQEGKANATRVRYLAVISHTFTVATRDWELCANNPCRNVRKPKEPRGRVRFLSDYERERLLTVAHQCKNPAILLIIQLALCTGGRQGEIRNLRWQDIDLVREQVTFHETKNDERRIVPLVEPALSALREYERTHRRIDTDLAFPSPTGKKLLVLNKTWERLIRRTGIEDFKFHDLRHSCASYLAQNGATLLEISEVLGHKSLTMVKRYAHLQPEHLRNPLQRMARSVLQQS